MSNEITKTKVIKGLLSPISFAPEEADKFLDYIIDSSVFKSSARVEKMKLAQKVIRPIGLATNVLKPRSVMSSEDIITSLASGPITLEAKKVRGAVLITDDDLEDSPEEGFKDHLLAMIAKKISNELDRAFYLSEPGATLEGQRLDLEDLWKGWRWRILNETNAVTGQARVLDARSATDFKFTTGYIAEQNGVAPFEWEIKFGKALKVMPGKYKKKGLENFRFFVNDEVESDYIEALSSRGTALGDKLIVEGGEVTYGRVPVIGAPLMPIDMPVPTGDALAVSAIESGEDVSAGETTLHVSDTTGFEVGQLIWFYDASTGYKSEVLQVKTITQDDNPEPPPDTLASGTIEFETGFLYPHAAGEHFAVVTTDGSDCLLTYKNNLIIGLHRDIKIEPQRDAKAEGTFFYFSMRADVAIENVNGCVLIKHLKVKP
jgi:hypothetical protein